MKKYTASQETINILLKNEYIEITKEIHPQHFKRLQKEGYDCRNTKRVFSANRDYGYKQDYIEFDYDMIKPVRRRGVSASEMKREITTEELKSFIGFYKLPYKERKRINVFNLESYYNSIKKYPEHYNKKTKAMSFIEMYENIRL